MDYDDFDPMSDMGNEEESYESMGFQIAEDAQSAFDLGGDAADDWLASEEATQASSANLRGEMQVGSIQQQSHTMQHAIQGIASGAISGGSLDSALGVDEARKALGSLYGDAPERVANRIKVPKPGPVTTIDPFTQQPISTKEYRLPDSTINKAASYLTNTLERNMDAGPGSRLHGQGDDSQQKKLDADRLQAYTMLGNIADKYYITGRTRDSDVYASRKESLTGELTKYLMDADLTQQGQSFLPVPNDLNTPGLVPTAGLRGPKGSSPYGRVESSKFLASHGVTGGLDFDNPFHRELAIRVPSLKRTLLSGDKESMDFEYGNLKRDVKFIRRVLRADGKTERDVDMGNEKRIAGLTDRDNDYSIAQEFRNFHSTQLSMAGVGEYQANDGFRGRDMSGGVKDSPEIMNLVDELEETVGKENRARRSREITAKRRELQREYLGKHGGQAIEGSETGGMYGMKEQSELQGAVEESVEAYNQMIAEGQDPDEALRRLTNKDRPNGLHLTYPADSAQAAFLKRAAEMGDPAQGTDAWKAQREGKVTGSIAEKLWMGKGDQRVAAILAERQIVKDMDEGPGKELAKLELDIGNSYTAAGNKYEDKARDIFLQTEGAGLSFEEAKFEEGTGEMAGMGASPDGHLFNKDGSSAGLLELKFLGEGGMKTAVKKYTPQVQYQMMITGEKQTHLFALDKETNEYQHELIKADPAMQKELLQLSKSALAQAPLITNKTELMMAKAKYKGARRVDSPAAKSGQKKSFDGAKEAEAPMTGFGSTPEPSSSKELVTLDYAEFAAHIEALDIDGDFNIDEMNNAQSEANSIEAQNNAKLKRASEEAADAIKKMSAAAGAAAVSIAKIALEGNASAMDTITFAREAGDDEARVRGTEFLMAEKGGQDLAKVRYNLSSAADWQRKFNDPLQQKAAITDIARQWGSMHMEDKGFGPTPTLPQMAALSPTDFQAMVMDRQAGSTNPEHIMDLDTVFNMKNAVSAGRVTGDELRSARVEMDADGQFEFFGAAKLEEQRVQAAQEAIAAKSGAAGGTLAQGAVELEKKAGLWSSVKEFGKYALGVAGVGGAVAGTASLSGGTAITAGAATLASAGVTSAAALGAVATPAAILAGAAIAGGGVGYAGGEAIRGTTVGGMIGDAGLNTMAFFGSDWAQEALDLQERGSMLAPGIALPDPSMNQAVAAPAKMGDVKVNTKNNIEVNVTVDPDMVSTDTTVNEEDYSNEVHNYGKG